jgi:methylmalonyl-CoA mutase N-terminal domain/subunit
VASTVDPLGGSYFVEALTDEMERQAEDYFARIDRYGGVIPAIEAGFMQSEIAEASFRYQTELEQHRRVVVGVNDFITQEEPPLDILRIPRHLEEEQAKRVTEVRRKRDQAPAARAINQLRKAAQSPRENLMPYILDAVRAYATEGEMMGAMVDVFGLYTERAII